MIYVASNTYTLYPGPSGAVSARLEGINDDNQATGSYYIDNAQGNGQYVLGVFYQNGSVFAPNANCPAETMTDGYMWLYGINGYGEIIGDYLSEDGTQNHGFLYHNATCTFIDVPGTSPGASLPFGINNNGQIVGEYWDGGSTYHAFMQDGSVYYSFDYPYAAGSPFTYAHGINDAAQIVGTAFPVVNGTCSPYAGFQYTLVPAQ